MAKAGLVAVPVNFRLVGSEIRYIVENAEAAAIIVQDDLVDRVEAIRADLPLASDRYIHFGAGKNARRLPLLRGPDRRRRARANRPIEVGPDDPFALLYTSGTTGKPKGAIRSNGSLVLHWPISTRSTSVSVAMTSAFWSCRCVTRTRSSSRSPLPPAAPRCCVYDRKSFDPEHLAEDACRRPLHLHLAGADPLHHDARIARGGEARPRCRQRHQAPHLLRAGAPRDQAGAHGVFPELAALRRLWLDRDGLGHVPASGGAADQARLDRARVPGTGRIKLLDADGRRGRRRRSPAKSMRARPTRFRDTGSCRRRRRRPSAATIARSATSPGATRTATTISSTARAT